MWHKPFFQVSDRCSPTVAQLFYSTVGHELLCHHPREFRKQGRQIVMSSSLLSGSQGPGRQVLTPSKQWLVPPLWLKVCLAVIFGSNKKLADFLEYLNKWQKLATSQRGIQLHFMAYWINEHPSANNITHAPSISQDEMKFIHFGWEKYHLFIILNVDNPACRGVLRMCQCFSNARCLTLE